MTDFFFFFCLPVEIICIQKVELQSVLQEQQATKKPWGETRTQSVDFLTSQLHWLYYLQHTQRQIIFINNALQPTVMEWFEGGGPALKQQHSRVDRLNKKGQQHAAGTERK